MDWKGAGLGLGIVALSPVAGAQPAKVELVCNGSFSFTSLQNTWEKTDSNGVYVRIEGVIVRIAGGIGDLHDAVATVDSENEAVVSFSNTRMSGNINRHTGRLVAHNSTKNGQKIDYLFDATCVRPKPLF